MPLSNRPVVFPDPLPAIGSEMTCVRGAARSGLERGAIYTLTLIVRDGVTHRGSGAKGYIVTSADGEVMPQLWHPSRFTPLPPSSDPA